MALGAPPVAWQADLVGAPAVGVAGGGTGWAALPAAGPGLAHAAAVVDRLLAEEDKASAVDLLTLLPKDGQPAAPYTGQPAGVRACVSLPAALHPGRPAAGSRARPPRPAPRSGCRCWSLRRRRACRRSCPSA